MDAVTMSEACIGGLVSLVLAASLSVGCGPSGPPPRPAEVPIDNSPPPGTFLFAPTAETTTTTEAPGVAQVGTARPTLIGVVPATPDPASSATPVAPALPAPGANHTPPPKAQRLSAADCSKLMDKYVGLVAISQGVAPDQVKNVLPMMKQAVSSDPNYAATLTACAAQNSKKQYACAMKSTSVDAWKACLE